MNAIYALSLLIPSCMGHISMQYPFPRDNGGSYAKWQQNEPQFPAHPQICHGLAQDTSIRTGNTFAAGDTIIIDLYGTAVHDGGHCAFWYSTDDRTFTKIIDVKDCTLVGAEVRLPNTMPTECNNRCTFAWTWTPRISQVCEIYMNCADIRVTGMLGQAPANPPVSIDFKTRFEDRGGAYNYGCIRVDETTHFTTIYGAIDTNYDHGDNEHQVSEPPSDPPANNNVCYSNPSMAINLNNDISNNGACGTGVNDYRCDDGHCCNVNGYCGDTPAYCDNPIGDWRTNDCDADTPTPTSPTPSPTPRPTPPPNTSPVTHSARFVSYIGQAGPGWGTPASNEEFLKVIGVPGYGGSKGYNYLNFAFWVSDSTNGGAAVNGAAFDWQNILNRITSTTLRNTLTGTVNPTADQLRSAIKALYNNAGIKIFISAFGGADHPMQNGADPVVTAGQLAAYAATYQYDGVDVDWEEAIIGKFAAGAGGEEWLCQITTALRNALPDDMEISHAPQSPYFMGSTLGQYPNGGYNTVHHNCGDMIDFYNVQFYNQGGSTYNTYDSLFVSSIGWSQNSAVYQIMDGASPENVQIPASKLVVGKHTNGDGSSFVDGATLKNVFNSALAAGRWSAGFMTWQFYKEVYPATGTPLIDSVITANWNGGGVPTTPTTPPPQVAPTPLPPTAPTPATQTGNIEIVNFGTSGQWYYAATLQGASPGWTVTKFEVLKDAGGWFSCDIESYAYKCNNLDSIISVPLSIQLTGTKDGAESVITGNNVVTSFSNNIVSDFGSNFEAGSPVVQTTKAPTPEPTPGDNPSTPTPPPSIPTEGGRLTITNRAGGGAWWYMVYVTDVPSNVAIATVEMMDQNMASWETGTHNAQEDYYIFSDNANLPYQPPFSFRVTTSNGHVVQQMNAMSSVSDGDSFTFDDSVLGGNPFSMGDSPNNPLTWTDWFTYISIGLMVVFVLVFLSFCYKRRQKGIGFIANSNNIGMELSKKDAAKNQYILSPDNRKSADATSPQKTAGV